MRAKQRAFSRIALASALSLAVGLFALSTASAEAPTVALGSFEAGVGHEGKVTLEVQGMDEPGLGAWTVDVVYDPEVVTPVDCEAQNQGICNTAYDEHTVRVVGINVYGLTGDVSLASITFACKHKGESDLGVELSVLADATPGGPQPIDAAVEHGAVVCTEGGSEPTPPKDDNPGDVNCDGKADSVDAALLLQLGAALVADLPCEHQGDVDESGGINSIDAALILQESAGLLV
ncbi:MAG: hypothetical protein Q8S13_01745 [Dehalococcoidia bacterium]|nr:hypothetical protein [Dehalococcoidia bacterium]